MQTITLKSTIKADHLLHLPDELPEGLTVKITIEPLSDHPPHSEPLSDIAHLAMAARNNYLQQGGKPMSQDEILAEMRQRRGEPADG